MRGLRNTQNSHGDVKYSIGNEVAKEPNTHDPWTGTMVGGLLDGKEYWAEGCQGGKIRTTVIA